MINVLDISPFSIFILNIIFQSIYNMLSIYNFS